MNAYYVQPGDQRLTDESVFENTSKQTLAYVGYDPASNSIISVFRGSSDWKNLI